MNPSYSSNAWTTNRLEFEAEVEQVLRNTLRQENDEVRDFVVWLCGYTDRDELPSSAEWEALREHVKKMAARFAVKSRERARRAY